MAGAPPADLGWSMRWLVRFGDFRLEFELIVWLTDEAILRPQKVMADYVWAVHSALEKHEIHISMPQRDLHFKSPETLSIRIEQPEPDAKDKAPDTEEKSAQSSDKQS